ncbi:hypothetical protein Y032_0147g2618 [Ancylostoma ceylanicum]|uniref:Uncharacterized protein n=1 Tax=Ancylostoma ceylanicum TaxID=53326 RepID=A0A016T2G1_9BILA|nr:hypothetical protein Y032_0147g2618 [Ancylostoma ceylanicum]
MVELEEAASEVPFDIIGLSGAQQTGSSVLRLQRSTLNKEAISSALEHLATSTDLSNYEQLKIATALAADGTSSKQVKESHISEGKTKLYECRHRLLHQFSARSSVEFSVVSKALRESLKADIE